MNARIPPDERPTIPAPESASERAFEEHIAALGGKWGPMKEPHAIVGTPPSRERIRVKRNTEETKMRDEKQEWAAKQQRDEREKRETRVAGRFTPSPTHADGNRHARRQRVVLLTRQIRELKRRDAAKAFRQAAKDAKKAQLESQSK
jgi:hypothetical protein